jgi:hypothetical protein
MAMRTAGKDEGNDKGGKSNDNGAKRAIVKKRAMASDSINKMMATEKMAQHCCCRHHCPCLSRCGNSFCFGVLAAAGNDLWWRMRAKVVAWGEGELCVEF